MKTSAPPVLSFGFGSAIAVLVAAAWIYGPPRWMRRAFWAAVGLICWLSLAGLESW